jgi:excisionase family DNA binding protein
MNYMTLEEAGEYLRLSKVTMYRLVTKKKIPVSKVGRKYLFSREKLDQWVEGKVVGRKKSGKTK